MSEEGYHRVLPTGTDFSIALESVYEIHQAEVRGFKTKVKNLCDVIKYQEQLIDQLKSRTQRAKHVVATTKAKLKKQALLQELIMNELKRNNISLPFDVSSSDEDEEEDNITKTTTDKSCPPQMFKDSLPGQAAHYHEPLVPKTHERVAALKETFSSMDGTHGEGANIVTVDADVCIECKKWYSGVQKEKMSGYVCQHKDNNSTDPKAWDITFPSSDECDKLLEK